MRIRVSAGFCAMICLMGWLDHVVCGCYILGMVVHEFGHFAALLLCGVGVKRLEVSFCGAVLETESMSYRKELICASAGPAGSILLGLCCLRRIPYLGMVALGQAAVNLLPLMPMDGGRMLRAFLMMRCSHRTAERVLHWVTTGTCLCLMLLACWGTIYLQAGVWPIFLALVLLWRAGGMEK